jgi:16S rRNA (cytosine967-C5)-methyltransferase
VTATARDVARRVLRRVEQGALATPALARALDGAGLSGRDRRLASELVHGVSRHRSRLDRALAAMAPRGLRRLSPAMRAALRVAAYQILVLDRIPAHAAVSDAVSAARAVGGARMAGFANGLLRRLARDGEPALPGPGDPRYIEVALSWPEPLVARLRESLSGIGEPAGESGDGEPAGEPVDPIAVARGFHEPASLYARVNPCRADVAQVIERLAAERCESEAEVSVAASPWCPGALAIAGLGAPETSPSWAEGLWTVQDVGAQLIGRFAAPRGGRILDACAGVGGKTTHLAELIDASDIGASDDGDAERVEIVAADVSEAKLEALATAAARLGITGIRPVVADLAGPADALDEAIGGDYDLVLLDAPCTGLGVLRRHPEAKWRITDADIDRMAALQARLLDALAPRVRPGGVLCYSVCSFVRAEGPAQVEAFLARHPAFALAPPEAASGSADQPPWDALGARDGVLRTWPHRHGADAFYAARLRRRQ